LSLLSFAVDFNFMRDEYKQSGISDIIYTKRGAGPDFSDKAQPVMHVRQVLARKKSSA